MTYEIDQSGKVEDTKLTVVAYANGKIKSVKIGSAEKQKLLADEKVDSVVNETVTKCNGFKMVCSIDDKIKF